MTAHPHALFISDLHLVANSPQLALFLKFMKEVAPKAERLYCLGDIFDFWVGDDDINPFHTQIIEAFKKCHDQGVELYWVSGNRDFLVSRRFFKQTGFKPLKDPTLLNYQGHRIVIGHGDRLCIDDIKYQRFRRIVNKRWLQWLFMQLPLSFRRNIALKIRDSSIKQGAENAKKQPMILDVNQQAVDALAEQFSSKIIIHGHTHRMATHNHPHLTRYVLGDWHKTGNYLQVSHSGIEQHIL